MNLTSQHCMLPQSLSDAHQEILFLRDELAQADFDPAYGLPTRRAFERRAAFIAGAMAVVYVDLDNLNAENAKHGDSVMDYRIRMAFAQAARHGDWYRYRSGDELAALVPLAAADVVASRCQDALMRQGLSGSIVIEPFADSLKATMARANMRLIAARRGRLRYAPRGWGWRAFIINRNGERIGGTFTCPWWAKPVVMWGVR